MAAKRVPKPPAAVDAVIDTLATEKALIAAKPPTPPPAITVDHTILLNAIVSQVTHYFALDSLARDSFLQAQMAPGCAVGLTTPQGCDPASPAVPLLVIARFPRIQELTLDVATVYRAILDQSSNPDKTRVRVETDALGTIWIGPPMIPGVTSPHARLLFGSQQAPAVRRHSAGAAKPPHHSIPASVSATSSTPSSGSGSSSAPAAARTATEPKKTAEDASTSKKAPVGPSAVGDEIFAALEAKAAADEEAAVEADNLRRHAEHLAEQKATDGETAASMFPHEVQSMPALGHDGAEFHSTQFDNFENAGPTGALYSGSSNPGYRPFGVFTPQSALIVHDLGQDKDPQVVLSLIEELTNEVVISAIPSKKNGSWFINFANALSCSLAFKQLQGKMMFEKPVRCNIKTQSAGALPYLGYGFMHQTSTPPPAPHGEAFDGPIPPLGEASAHESSSSSPMRAAVAGSGSHEDAHFDTSMAATAAAVTNLATSSPMTQPPMTAQMHPASHHSATGAHPVMSAANNGHSATEATFDDMDETTGHGGFFSGTADDESGEYGQGVTRAHPADAGAAFFFDGPGSGMCSASPMAGPAGVAEGNYYGEAAFSNAAIEAAEHAAAYHHGADNGAGFFAGGGAEADSHGHYAEMVHQHHDEASTTAAAPAPTQAPKRKMPMISPLLAGAALRAEAAAAETDAKKEATKEKSNNDTGAKKGGPMRRGAAGATSSSSKNGHSSFASSMHGGPAPPAPLHIDEPPVLRYVGEHSGQLYSYETRVVHVGRTHAEAENAKAATTTAASTSTKAPTTAEGETKPSGPAKAIPGAVVKKAVKKPATATAAVPAPPVSVCTGDEELTPAASTSASASAPKKPEEAAPSPPTAVDATSPHGPHAAVSKRMMKGCLSGKKSTNNTNGSNGASSNAQRAAPKPMAKGNGSPVQRSPAVAMAMLSNDAPAASAPTAFSAAMQSAQLNDTSSDDDEVPTARSARVVAPVKKMATQKPSSSFFATADADSVDASTNDDEGKKSTDEQDASSGVESPKWSEMHSEVLSSDQIEAETLERKAKAEQERKQAMKRTIAKPLGQADKFTALRGAGGGSSSNVSSPNASGPLRVFARTGAQSAADEKDKDKKKHHALALKPEERHGVPAVKKEEKHEIVEKRERVNPWAARAAAATTTAAAPEPKPAAAPQKPAEQKTAAAKPTTAPAGKTTTASPKVATKATTKVAAPAAVVASSSGVSTAASELDSNDSPPSLSTPVSQQKQSFSYAAAARLAPPTPLM